MHVVFGLVRAQVGATHFNSLQHLYRIAENLRTLSGWPLKFARANPHSEGAHVDYRNTNPVQARDYKGCGLTTTGK